MVVTLMPLTHHLCTWHLVMALWTRPQSFVNSHHFHVHYRKLHRDIFIKLIAITLYFSDIPNRWPCIFKNINDYNFQIQYLFWRHFSIIYSYEINFKSFHRLYCVCEDSFCVLSGNGNFQMSYNWSLQLNI